jgi:hypothetical protein
VDGGISAMAIGSPAPLPMQKQKRIPSRAWAWTSASLVLAPLHCRTSKTGGSACSRGLRSDAGDGELGAWGNCTRIHPSHARGDLAGCSIPCSPQSPGASHVRLPVDTYTSFTGQTAEASAHHPIQQHRTRRADGMHFVCRRHPRTCPPRTCPAGPPDPWPRQVGEG